MKKKIYISRKIAAMYFYFNHNTKKYVYILVDNFLRENQVKKKVKVSNKNQTVCIEGSERVH